MTNKILNGSDNNKMKPCSAYDGQNAIWQTTNLRARVNARTTKSYVCQITFWAFARGFAMARAYAFIGIVTHRKYARKVTPFGREAALTYSRTDAMAASRVLRGMFIASLFHSVGWRLNRYARLAD